MLVAIPPESGERIRRCPGHKGQRLFVRRRLPPYEAVSTRIAQERHRCILGSVEAGVRLGAVKRARSVQLVAVLPLALEIGLRLFDVDLAHPDEWRAPQALGARERVESMLNGHRANPVGVWRRGRDSNSRWASDP